MNNTCLNNPRLDPVTVRSEPATAIGVTTANTADVEPEEIVIYDECGDTLWDKVLSQELKNKK